MGNAFTVGDYIIGFISDKSNFIPTGFEEASYISNIKNGNALGWFDNDIKNNYEYLPLVDVSHLINEFKILDEGVLIKAKILATPKGHILKKLCEKNISINFSILKNSGGIISINIMFNDNSI